MVEKSMKERNSGFELSDSKTVDSILVPISNPRVPTMGYDAIPESDMK